MRAHEVFVHAADLGVPYADLPPDFLVALVVEAAGKHAFNGSAAELAAWLTGRTGEPPALGAWL